MKEKTFQALLSVIVVLFVGIFGWAHGTPGRRKNPLTLEDVALGLCRGGGEHGRESGDVPHYPGSGGMTVNLDNGEVLHYSAVPASVQDALDFYSAALSGNGWERFDVPPMTDPFILWFHKGGRECIASFSESGPHSTNVVLITK